MLCAFRGEKEAEYEKVKASPDIVAFTLQMLDEIELDQVTNLRHMSLLMLLMNLYIK
jgi:hypothetical protein